jgi:hypothetical protein
MACNTHLKMDMDMSEQDQWVEFVRVWGHLLSSWLVERRTCRQCGAPAGARCPGGGSHSARIWDARAKREGVLR